jgi:hypothetical protein
MYFHGFLSWEAVLWIRDFLIRIRIRIRGSVPFDLQIRFRLRILLFSSVTSRCQQKIFHFLSFFAYYRYPVLFEGYIYIILQWKKVIKKLNNSRNQGLSYAFCFIMERSRSGSRSVQNNDGSVRSKNIRVFQIRIHNTLVKADWSLYWLDVESVQMRWAVYSQSTYSTYFVSLLDVVKLR